MKGSKKGMTGMKESSAYGKPTGGSKVGMTGMKEKCLEPMEKNGSGGGKAEGPRPETTTSSKRY